MKRSLLRGLGALLFTLAKAAHSHADAGASSEVQAPAPVQAPAEASQPPTQVFALIVTSNRSADLDRSDLQYADDDGARYHKLFSMTSAPGDVALLTRFDRQSSAQYPELARDVHPPRKSDVASAARAMGERIAKARASGKKTAFYFVYAGHGRVDEGRGELELEDGRMDAAFIEREILANVSADQRHIILDSCNSFFVLNPRKPGGRRWATPQDMALGFGDRHPDVGLLLSTNSEAEVYEWSELESGVFSYEVRSGLSGAADVNGDGEISYDELAGFIDRANASVPREQYRPQVFARGPSGQGARSLFNWKAAQGRRVELGPEQRHVWVRGAEGARLMDVHQEPAAVAFVIPATPDESLEIFEQTTGKRPEGGRPALRKYTTTTGEGAVKLASLEPAPAGMSPRGDGVFRHLFAVPYGPAAFQAYQREQTTRDPPVYGLTREDEARVRHYLEALNDIEGQNRRTMGYSFLGTGALFGAVGAAQLFDTDRRELRNSGAIFSAVGVGSLAVGAYALLSTSRGEETYTEFNRRLELHPNDRAAIIADTEMRLEEIAKRERQGRIRGAWFIGITGAAIMGLTTYGLAFPPAGEDRPRPWAYALGYGVGTAYIGGAFLIANLQTPTERVLKLYRQDPDLKLKFDVAPAPGGGAMFGLSGSFR